MTDVTVRRLRTNGTRAGAERLLRRAVGDAPDRSVLIVRRLVVAGDPGAARDRLAQLRRTAARPAADGLWLDAGSAEAVLFEDEAQLLACLTADLVSGWARQRWYWRPRLGPGATGPLLRAWLDDARWLPAALQLLDVVRPDAISAAVETLTPAELRAVAAAVTHAGMALPSPLDSSTRHRPGRPRAAAAVPDVVSAEGRERPPSTGTARPAEPSLEPPAAHRPAPVEARPAPLHQPGLGQGLPPPAGSSPSAPTSPGVAVPAVRRAAPPTDEAGPVTQAAPAVITREVEADSATITPAARAEPNQAAARPPPDPSPAEPAAPNASMGQGSPTVLPRRAPSGRRRPPDQRAVPGVPITVESRFAGVLYLLPLLLRMSGPADGPRPTWTELSDFGRRVLGRRARSRRGARDPLWMVLAALAEPDRERNVRRTRAEPWWPDALEFLAGHDVGPAGLAIRGRIAVTRTHVDLILGLDQIDLRIRRAGLDHDPGWVPSLRRIVSFHYL